MSQRAWAYIYGILLFGLLLAGLAVWQEPRPAVPWPTFTVFLILATIAQLVRALGPTHDAYHFNLVVLFAGVYLLPLPWFMLLVLLPHLVEWVKERLVHSASLRNWYIQPFNIAVHIIAGTVAYQFHGSLEPSPSAFISAAAVAAAIVAALAYTTLNHLLIAQALVLARRISWQESGALDGQSILTDIILLLLGYVVAAVWTFNPWLAIPALAPLILMYRALKIPRLEKVAHSDEKTGLWNAHHFADMLTAEMERAGRFARPLALIMADLDLLRNINNTYGHLAGDAVLVGIAAIIRQTIRTYDIAARFGGEEFCIALPETRLAEAIVVAQRIRLAVEAASFDVKTSTSPIRATVSLGVASFPLHAATPSGLIHQADLAVYQAKLKGRNRVASADDVSDSVLRGAVHADERIDAASSTAYVPRPPLTRSKGGPPAGTAPQPRSRRAILLGAGVGLAIGVTAALRAAAARLRHLLASPS